MERIVDFTLFRFQFSEIFGKFLILDIRICREHEGRPVELGGRVKGCFKKEKLESGAESPTKSISGNIKNGINDPSKPGLNKKVK